MFLKPERGRQGAWTSGAIAVEFALIAPVLLLMFFGSLELARAVDCRTRVVDAASTVADLVAQGSALTPDDASKILCAAKAVLYPYPTAGTVQLRISSIVCSQFTAGACNTMSIASADGGWALATANTAPRTAIPSDLQPAMFPAQGAGVVMVEVTYTYNSATTQFLAGSISMSKTAYSVPRGNGSVSFSGTTTIADCTV